MELLGAAPFGFNENFTGNASLESTLLETEEQLFEEVREMILIPIKNGSLTSFGAEPTEVLIFDNPWVRTVLIVVYSVIFALCFFGNLAVVLVVTLHWKMRSITKFFLGNLAFANLCVGIFCVYQNLSTYLMDSWLFGDFMCKMYHFTNSLSHTASILILVVICVERYLVILHYFWYIRVLSIKGLRVIILIVWGISAVLCSPRLYYYKTIRVDSEASICALHKSIYDSETADMIYFVVLFLLPLSVTTILYTKIGLYLRRSGKLAPGANSDAGAAAAAAGEFQSGSGNENSLEIPVGASASPAPAPHNHPLQSSPLTPRGGAGFRFSVGSRNNCKYKSGALQEQQLYDNESRRMSDLSRTSRSKFIIQNDDLSPERKKAKVSHRTREGCDLNSNDNGKYSSKRTGNKASKANSNGPTKRKRTNGSNICIDLNSKLSNKCGCITYDNGENKNCDDGEAPYAPTSREGMDSPDGVLPLAPIPSSCHENRVGSRHNGLLGHEPEYEEADQGEEQTEIGTVLLPMHCCHNSPQGNSNPGMRDGFSSSSSQSPPPPQPLHVGDPPTWSEPQNPSPQQQRSPSTPSTRSTNDSDRKHQRLSPSRQQEACTSRNSSKRLRRMGGSTASIRDRRISSQALRRAMKHRDAVRMFIVIVVTFAICNLPYHMRKLCLNHLEKYNEYDFQSDYVYLITVITHLLMYTNCAINPILYGFLSPSFRSSLKELMRCQFKRIHQEGCSVYP